MRHPVTLTVLAAGPLLWLLGAFSGSAVISELGRTISWLVLLVPVFSVLAGSYAARRPGSSELYVPVRWTFAEDWIGLEQADRHARADWTEFRSWRSAAGCYLLHTSAQRYVIVPIRDVRESDRSDLEALFAAKLGARRR